MATRRELLEAVSARYRGGTRAERSRILDEFAAVTGYHRKHAIRLLAALGKREEADDFVLPARACARTYGVEVRDALIQLWEVADRVCSKRLRPMLPVLLPALERHGRVVLDEATRAKLLAVSAASIDRLLADVRAVAGGGRRRPAGFGSAVRRSVPVRTFNGWGNPAPGWVEVDFVAHGGTTVSGAFAQTMVLTDIATGWTECIPIVVREAEMVVHALSLASAALLVSLGAVLANAALPTLLGILLAITSGIREDSCQEAIVARVPSPDGAWEARVDETACLYGMGVGAVTAGVNLVSTRDPARTAVLLGVDTGGHHDERPRLAWTAPDVLEVTVYDHSYLKVLTREFGGVRVDLRYDPDDPADRAAWQRKHGMSPEP